VIAWPGEADQKIPSSDTGAYSKARGRLPEGVVKTVEKTAQSLDEQALDQALWCGRTHLRRVFGVDERYTRQGVYPQHSTSGLGFPIAKIVVMFSLVTGTLMAG